MATYAKEIGADKIFADFFAVLKPGRFVRCAVTDKAIPLEALRYWSPTRQEAYWGPGEFISRLNPPS